MSCRCSHSTSGDTGRAIADISWSGPQMGNRGVRFGPRRPTLDELDEPKEVLHSEVIELVSQRQLLLDGRQNTSEQIPLPPFSTEQVDAAVLSVAVAAKSGLDGGGRRLWVRIQNAVQTRDDPARTFVENGAAVEIDLNSPSLLTVAWPVVGPGARLLLDWVQGSTEASASVTLSAWLTLRRRGPVAPGG